MKPITQCLGCDDPHTSWSQVCADCIRHYYLATGLCACEKCDAVRVHVVGPVAASMAADPILEAING